MAAGIFGEVMGQTTYTVTPTVTNCTGMTNISNCGNGLTYQGNIFKLQHISTVGNTFNFRLTKCDGSALSNPNGGWFNVRNSICQSLLSNFNANEVIMGAGQSQWSFSLTASSSFTSGSATLMCAIGVGGTPTADPVNRTYFYTTQITVTATTAPACTPPASPTGLSATAGNNQINLSWNAVSGATHYRLYDNGNDLGIATQNTNYNLTGLNNGSNYCITIKAFNSNNATCLSASSNQACATPQAPQNFLIVTEKNPPAGGSVQGGGTFTQGQTANLTATPNSGYIFSNWTENGNVVSSNANYSFQVTSSRNLFANFLFVLPSYTISHTANPNAGGTLTGAGTYISGQNVTLRATPNAGYTFVNWTSNGNQLSTNATYAFQIVSNMNVVANFQAIPQNYTISVAASPAAGGNLQGGGNYTQGQTANLSAFPTVGYTFSNWTENGNVVSNSANYNFIVTSNRNLVANFQQIQQPLCYWCVSNFKATRFPNTLGNNILEGGCDKNISFTIAHTNATNINRNIKVYFGSPSLPVGGGFLIYDAMISLGVGQTVTIDRNNQPNNVVSGGNLGGIVSSAAGNYRMDVVIDGIVTSATSTNVTIQGNNNTNCGVALPMYSISLAANPTVGGSLQGGGTFIQGQTANLVATANSGYSFVNWTENGNNVSTSTNYTFVVSVNRNLVANFQQQTTPTVATPEINPNSGSYITTQNVVISCATAGATIRYTTNGTDVTANSSVYSATLAISQNTTIKAKAYKTGSNESLQAVATYTINSTPIITGTYNADPCNVWIRFKNSNADVDTPELKNGNASHNLSPAELIYYCAKENTMNPVLLIGKLQDEQSLIEQGVNSNFEARLLRATGYGALDGGDLSKWYGFYPQNVGATYQYSLSKNAGLSFEAAYEKYTTGAGKYLNFIQNIYPKYAAKMNNVANKNYSISPTSQGYYEDFRDVTIQQIQALLNSYNGELKNSTLFSGNAAGDISRCGVVLQATPEPVMIEPTNNSTTVTQPIIFKWQPVSVANLYGFALVADATNTTIYETYNLPNTQTQLTLPATIILQQGIKYRWRAMAYSNAAGWSPKLMAAWYFTLQAPTQQLGTATITIIIPPPFLGQWKFTNEANWRNAGTVNNLALENYTVEFQIVTGYTKPANQSFTLAANNLSAIIFGTYTIQVAPPPTPILSVCNDLELNLPRNGATGMPLRTNFSWLAYEGAGISYDVEISTTPNFQTIYRTETTTSTTLNSDNSISFSFADAGNETYYWRVTAKRNGTTIAKSAIRSFITRNQPAATGHGSALGAFNNTISYKNTLKDGASYSLDGKYMGMSWQCVEFCRRYFWINYGLHFSTLGNANTFPTNAPALGFTVFANRGQQIPKIGDILCFDGNTYDNYGHVAIIQNIVFNGNNTYTLCLAHQNVGSLASINYCEIKMTFSNGNYTVNRWCFDDKCKDYRNITHWIRAKAATPIEPINKKLVTNSTPALAWELQTNATINSYTVYMHYKDANGCWATNSAISFSNILSTQNFVNLFTPENRRVLAAGDYRWKVVAEVSAGRLISEYAYFTVSPNAMPKNEGGNSIGVRVLGSLLPNATISLKQADGSFEEKTKTDENGNASLSFYPAVKKDDILRIEAAGYQSVELAIDDNILQNGLVNIPMFRSITPTEKIVRPALTLLGAAVTDKNTANFKVSAENHKKVLVWKDSSYVELATPLNNENTFTATLDTGRNYVNVIIVNEKDTVNLQKEVIYYATSVNASKTYNVEITAGQTVIGSQVYVDGVFYTTITDATTILSLTNGDKTLRFTRLGYLDMLQKVTTSTSRLLVNLAPQPVPAPIQPEFIFNMKDNKPVYINDVSIQNTTATINNRILVRKKQVDYKDKGLVDISETVTVIKIDGTTPTLKLGYVLDQITAPEPDFSYLMLIYNGNQFKKLFPSQFGDSVVYDKISQKVIINRFRPDTRMDYVFMSRKKPLINANTIIAATNANISINPTDALPILRYPITKLFGYPDSVKQGLDVFIGEYNDKEMSIRKEGNDLIIKLLKGFNKAGSVVKLSASHDGLSEVGTFRVIGADDIILGFEDDILSKSTQVYPNPSNGLFNVDIDSEYIGELSFSVTDVTGRTIKSWKQAKEQTKQKIEVNLADKASGVYCLSISHSKGKTVKMLVKN